MERNEKTRALLAAFGCALAYLLAGKALGAVLPQVPEEAARMWAFVHRCAAAPIVEELVFRGIIQQLARPLGERQAVALQAVLNIAVVTNTIPNTGISLPFFSSGGTSLLMLLGEMGIVLSVSRQTDMV